MGTLYQLLSLPACFLLFGLLRGDCRCLLASLARRLALLTGADDAARVELMKRFSPGIACGFMDSMRRRDGVAMRECSRRTTAPGAAAESRYRGAADGIVGAPGIGANPRRSAAAPVAVQRVGSAGLCLRSRRLALRSGVGSP